ncbi:MAG: phosphomannose isomerase type II C-terminal cupin domain [Rhodospirillales bacterium]|nr:phosphomannose isomerase type II C-terminal cupin domain [Rhodospirillales bacterium]
MDKSTFGADGWDALVAPLAKGQDIDDNIQCVDRPWGWYKVLVQGESFQVKQLSVIPDAKLSLQLHRYRAEHWVVTAGQIRVTKGKEQFDLLENESTFVQMGEVHRLENVTKNIVTILEIQTGDYLGEDDIVRFDDTYGRIDDE